VELAGLQFRAGPAKPGPALREDQQHVLEQSRDTYSLAFAKFTTFAILGGKGTGLRR
jgi:hypothetical protein